MASPILNHMKDDSIAFIDDVSEKARLVEDREPSPVLNRDKQTKSPLKAKNLANAKNGVPGVQLSTSEGDEVIEDSETAKLLGSNEKVNKDSTKEDVGVVEVVTTHVEKVVKTNITKEEGKTEIIIERSDTVVENIVNLSSDSPKKDKEDQNDSEKEKKEPETPEKTDASKDDTEDKIIIEKKKPDPILIISPASDDEKKDVMKEPVQVEIPRDIVPASIISDFTGDTTPSETASDSCTDTYDMYQTVGSVTPNSLSNADVFRSFAVTLASSEGTFISAESALGSTEEAPTSPRSLLATEMGSVQLEPVDQSSEDKEIVSQKDREESSETKVGSDDHLADGDLQRDVTFEEAAILAPVVMYPAQVHQYCPPGLEALLDCGQLVIHKDNLRHNKAFNNEALSRMEVIDISRQVIFYVEQAAYIGDHHICIGSKDRTGVQSHSWSVVTTIIKMPQEMALLPKLPPLSEKSFLFKLYNKSKQEVMQVYNPQSSACVACGASWHCFRKCHFQTLVFAPLGQVAGFIKRSHTYFVQEYLVMNSQEDVLLVMRGGPDDLEIYTPDLENELGRLAVHHWHGIMHEVRRSNSDYGITFPIDLDVRVKAVLLGAVFALDWIYTTRGGRR